MNGECIKQPCHRKPISRGMCATHYKAWQRANPDATRAYRKRKGNKKQCARCEQWKPLSMYYKTTITYCIPCHLDYQAERRAQQRG